MAITAVCDACGASYRLVEQLSGKLLKCKACSHVFKAVEERWKLKMRGGQIFGPLTRAEIDRMAQEGVVTMDCQVMKEGSRQWEWAGNVFEHAVEEQSANSRRAGTVTPRSGGLPTSGLLNRILCVRSELAPAVQGKQMAWDNQIIEEAQRSPVSLAWRGGKTIQVGVPYQFGPRFSENFCVTPPQRPDSPADTVTVTALNDGLDEFYVVGAWKGQKRLAREFFAPVPFSLAHAVALTRHQFAGSKGVGLWEEPGGNLVGPVATGARRAEENLARDVRWGDSTFQWAIQAVPLGSEQFFYAAQSAEKGPFARYIGIDWFMGRRNAFVDALEKFGPGTADDYKAEFMHASFSAQVLAAMYALD